MKTIKKGRTQKGPSHERKCTGKGNGDGGCSSVLLIEQGDLFQTYRCIMGRDEVYYSTFMCSECGVMTDVDEGGRNLMKKGEWLRQHPNHVNPTIAEDSSKVEVEKIFPDAYYSDDYIGLEAGEWKFYYGYEKTTCSIHGHNENICIEKDCPNHYCNDLLWCFTAEKNGEEIVRYSSIELEVGKMDQDDVWSYILRGIGKMLIEGKL